MCNALEEMGLTVEVHYTTRRLPPQNEIGVKFNTLVKKADETQTLKYVVHNVADAYGRTRDLSCRSHCTVTTVRMHVRMSI